MPANRTCGPATVQILLHLGHSDWREGPAGEAPQQANGVGLATDGHFSVLPCERPLEGVRPDRCERPSMHSGAMPNDWKGMESPAQRSLSTRATDSSEIPRTYRAPIVL